MSEYKIEKDVPLRESRGGRRFKYPFPDLEVGDSFFVPLPAGKKLGRHQADMASVAILYRRKRGNGWDYTTRQEKGGVRIWRTA